MTKKATLESARKLAQESDEAQRKAAEITRPAHAKALDEARAVRDDLSARLDSTRTRARLAEIIENGTSKRAPNPDTATTILAQYVQRLSSATNALASQLSDAGFLWTSVHRYITDWTWRLDEQQQVKVLDAFVLASQGKIDGGLAEFPREWSGLVENFAKLEALAWLSDRKAAEKYRAELDELNRQHDEARDLVDALESATPTLYRLNVDRGAQTFQVQVHGKSPIEVGGMTFDPQRDKRASPLPGSAGTVWEVSEEDASRIIRDEKFKVLSNRGEVKLDVYTPGLVEAV